MTSMVGLGEILEQPEQFLEQARAVCLTLPMRSRGTQGWQESAQLWRRGGRQQRYDALCSNPPHQSTQRGRERREGEAVAGQVDAATGQQRGFASMSGGELRDEAGLARPGVATKQDSGQATHAHPVETPLEDG
jgi:hypothetical protein